VVSPKDHTKRATQQIRTVATGREKPMCTPVSIIASATKKK